MRPAPLDALAPDFATIFDGTTPWWRPGFMDVAKVIGWRWIFILPFPVIVIGVPVMMVMQPPQMSVIIGGEIQLIAFAFAAAFSTVLWALKRAVKWRKDSFCIHCGYSLDGHEEDGTCPECGRGFSRATINEYRKDPHFFVDRWRALKDAPKGVVFAAGSGPTPDDGTR